MVTESGAIKTETAYDKKLYKKINTAGFILSAVLIVVFFIMGVFGIYSLFQTSETDAMDIIMIACAVFGLVCSLFLLIVRVNAYKKMLKGEKRNVAELYSEYMFVCEYENELQISQSKIYYKNIFRRTENSDYFFIYLNANAFLPIGKQGLTSAELNGVRRLLNLPQVAGESEFVPESSLHAETVCTVAPPSEEIFEDFPENKGGEK